MIGIHGVGLNMFHFVPFNSAIVEIYKGTQVQKNSDNFVNHVRDDTYIKTDAYVNKEGILQKIKVWSTLQSAINESGEVTIKLIL